MKLRWHKQIRCKPTSSGLHLKLVSYTKGLWDFFGSIDWFNVPERNVWWGAFFTIQVDSTKDWSIAMLKPIQGKATVNLDIFSSLSSGLPVHGISLSIVAPVEKSAYFFGIHGSLEGQFLLRISHHPSGRYNRVGPRSRVSWPSVLTLKPTWIASSWS